MNEALALVVASALEQAAGVAELDRPWAEAWASDLEALIDEIGGRVDDVIDALGGPGHEEARRVLQRGAGDVRIDGAMELADGRELSMVLRCSYDGDDEHLVIADLVAGPPQSVGAIHLAEIDLLDSFDDGGMRAERRQIDVERACERLAAALRATEHPARSVVANARLVLARLRTVLDDVPAAPRPGPVDLALAPRDRDEDRAVLDVFRRAVGEPGPVDHTTVAAIAARLRSAAAVDDPLAVWLASSVGPVDLDEPPLEVVVQAVAATIVPRDGAVLWESQREATSVLEPADWLGALVELLREGAGAAVDPDSLVDRLNRCPEVTTSVSKRDRPRVAWAFGVMCGSWPALGLLDDGRLTSFGVAVLPRAADVAWGEPAESGSDALPNL